jgi:hypothetical protein
MFIMKNIISLLSFIVIVFSCKKSTVDVEKSNTSLNNHPLEQPYDSTANIFSEGMYKEKEILKIIGEFGPLSIRKENDTWYIYRFEDLSIYSGTRFKLFRVPIDSIYNAESTNVDIQMKYFYVEPYSENENEYLIDYIDKLNNIYSAEGIDYDIKKNIFKEYKLTNEIKLEKFGFDRNDNDTINNVNGSATLFNTTKNRIKNIKLKISVFDDLFDGKLISEDEFIIKDTINKSELKIVWINYKPKKQFKSEGVTPMNIEIIDYDKF